VAAFTTKVDQQKELLMQDWIPGKNRSLADARLSRREFNAVCQVALVPAIWPWTGLPRIIEGAVNYLQEVGQPRDTQGGGQAVAGVTALVTTAILRSGRSAGDPVVAKSLKCLESFVQPDGGIYSPGGLLANYETCLAIVCLSEADADQRYQHLLRQAETFVRKFQWDERTGKDPSDLSYGGAGYGKHKRPDLSNTAFLLDALRSCGAGADDPAVQKALVFVSRCQNFESPHNTAPFAAKNPDGGFYYTCAAGGVSAAGNTPNGGLRSYGSMTYSGLKSMIYAGLKADDLRVKAAVAWLRKNYDLKNNPGLGSAGLYYYYHVCAKALHALGEDPFADAAGEKHDWRGELAQELAGRQREDGSWLNENSRWMEGDPALVTAYALLTLSYCRPAAEKAGSPRPSGAA
jgi:squalene-hopene/tetraprenyl-beta-curcumene cyclase